LGRPLLSLKLAEREWEKIEVTALQGSRLGAGLSLVALLLGSAAHPPGIAEEHPSAEAVSIQEAISGTKADEVQKDPFGADDKSLRTSVFRLKKGIIDDITATAPTQFRAWTNELLTAVERRELAAICYKNAPPVGGNA
jgi:hypothetical protein